MTDFDLELCDVQGRLFALCVTNGYGTDIYEKIINLVTSKELDYRYNCKQCFVEKYLFDVLYQ